MHFTQLCGTAFLLMLGACGGDHVIYECDTDAGAAGGGAPYVTLPDLPGMGPAPSQASLCKLTLNASTIDDVQALLGPGDSDSSGNGTSELFYEYAGASVDISFTFTNGVFEQAMVSNMPYPKCWTDEMPEFFPPAPPENPNH